MRSIFPEMSYYFQCVGGTLFGVNNDTGVLGANYTIGNQPGVVGNTLIIQLNSKVLSTLSFAEIEVRVGK
jgi:hypothetical protein